MPRKLEIEILADAAKYSRGLKEAESRTGKFAKAAGVAGAAITGGLVVALTKSVGAAMDAQRVQAQTENQLKQLGISYKAHASQIDKVIQSTSKLAAIDDEELQGAFNDLVRATGNVNTALKDTALAADVSRGAHVSLERAQRAVMAAEQGRVTALRRLGVDMPKVTTAVDALKASSDKYTDAQLAAAKAEDLRSTKLTAIDALQQKFAGSAEAYGKTAAGAQERLGVAIENLEESLGALLLPTVTKVAEAMSRLAGFFEKHQELAKAVTIAVAALGATMIATSVAMKVATTAQILLNAAMAANPIGLVIIAVAGLTAGLIVAYKTSATFREIVSDAFKIARIAATAEIGLILTAIDKFMGGLQAVFEAAGHLPFIGGKFDGIADAIGRARERVRDLRNTIMGLEGKDVTVKVNLRYSSDAPGRPGDGIIGADGLMPVVEKDIEAMGRAYLATSAGRTAFGGKAANPGGLVDRILDDLAFAQSYGLSLTSGYRPGAITSTGHKSLHSVGRAIDVAGSPSSMAAFARAEVNRPGIQELLYTPVGGWYPGVGWTRLSGQLARDHYSHVHVGVFDKGGWLMPGQLGINLTRKPEAVIPADGSVGGDIVIHHQTILDGRVVEESVRRETYRYQQRNGSSGYR